MQVMKKCLLLRAVPALAPVPPGHERVLVRGLKESPLVPETGTVSVGVALIWTGSCIGNRAAVVEYACPIMDSL